MRLTQVKFAEKIGTTQNVYTRYETGKLEIPDHLKSTLHDLGINLNWLLTGEGEMFQAIQPMDASFLGGETIRLPIVAEIAAGLPCEALDAEPIGHLEIPRALLSFPPPYLVFRITGRSMEPLLLSGDIVVCSENWEGVERNGKIMAFLTADGITIKRLVEDVKHKVTWLMPLNQDFAPMLYVEGSEEITMIGMLDLTVRRHNRD
jgi:SOS-response transcriptional repressor LexA